MAAAALFSTGGAAIKACSLDGPQVACLRSGIAAIALLMVLPAARRGWTSRGTAIGAVYAATMVLFVWANKLTTAASAIFLQSTAPVFILLLGPWLLREPARRRDVIFTAALAGAMLLILSGSSAPQQSAPDPVRGNILGLASGMTYALAVMGLRWSARSESQEGGPGSAAAVVLAGNALAFAACLPLAWPLPRVGAADAAVLAYLGVFQIALAYVLLIRGVRGVTALEASLLLLVEPMLNPLWAWLAQGEAPSAAALAGGAVILAATTARSILGAREATGTGPISSS